MAAFYELRLYQVARGRATAMQARWSGPLVPLFARHGVRPCCAWMATDAAGDPLLIYLMPWTTMAERAAAWAGFYGDPEWLRVREQTNAGSELVERYALNFLQAVVPPQASDPDHAAATLWLPRIAIGQSGAARTWLSGEAAAVCARTGGKLLSAFECLTGDDLPRAAVFIGWPDAAQRAAATVLDPSGVLSAGARYALEPLAAGVYPL